MRAVAVIAVALGSLGSVYFGSDPKIAFGIVVGSAFTALILAIAGDEK